ncbi:MAG TPA: type II secretion system F family protein [Tepidisphaeraceae bacterium]|nr:type II secretion system F family protein [Tepidisphaeraceae bacterium]
MPVFLYTALNRQGQQTTGTLSAESRAAALDQVLDKGLSPVAVNEQQDPHAVNASSGSNRISQRSVEAFTRELANLLAAGLPLSRSLYLLQREASQPGARKAWSAIHEDVVGGIALAEALAKWPKAFSTVYVAMVRAGETGGFLPLVLQQIADFRTREQDLKGKVKAAMVYPAVLAVFACVVVVVLLTFFIPRFSGIFAEFGSKLPWLTRAVVGASEALMNYGLFIAIALAAIIIALKRAIATEAGRRVIEQATLKIPGVGQVIARFALVRFCRMLGTLVGAGVPLISSLRVAKEALGNQTLADAVSFAIEEVQRGASLARSLASCPQLFPPSVVEMVTVAEETGRLDKELVRLSLAFEGDMDRQLRMLVALAEPMLLFLMAGIIGTVVVGMLLPVFSLQDLVK